MLRTAVNITGDARCAVIILVVWTKGRLAINETAIMRPNPETAEHVEKAGGGPAE